MERHWRQLLACGCLGVSTRRSHPLAAAELRLPADEATAVAGSPQQGAGKCRHHTASAPAGGATTTAGNRRAASCLASLKSVRGQPYATRSESSVITAATPPLLGSREARNASWGSASYRATTYSVPCARVPQRPAEGSPGRSVSNPQRWLCSGAGMPGGHDQAAGRAFRSTKAAACSPWRAAR